MYYWTSMQGKSKVKIPRWIHVPWFIITIVVCIFETARRSDGILTGNLLSLCWLSLGAWQIFLIRGWIR